MLEWDSDHTVSFITPNEVLENMAPEIEFIVEWGNNEENIKLEKE